LGGLFLAAGVLALLLAALVLGWGLAWLVIALAAANLFLGFCAGVLSITGWRGGTSFAAAYHRT
jgi:hypothetical protein